MTVGPIWLAYLMEKKVQAQKVIPTPFHFNNILLHGAPKRCSSKLSIYSTLSTAAAAQEEATTAGNSAWRGEQQRKSLFPPQHLKTLKEISHNLTETRRSEPWFLLSWGRASSRGLFLIPRRAACQHLEGEKRDTAEACQGSAVQRRVSRSCSPALGLRHAPREAAQASRQLSRCLRQAS